MMIPHLKARRPLSSVIDMESHNMIVRSSRWWCRGGLNDFGRAWAEQGRLTGWADSVGLLTAQTLAYIACADIRGPTALNPQGDQSCRWQNLEHCRPFGRVLLATSTWIA